MTFPAPDPIPLPAPVWLLKTLHIFTLSLHFCAVYVVVGGLALALAWHMRGHRAAAGASAALTPKLPVAMTYLVNLGIPPLLFAQTLYGRALYTSSVLIGSYWLSVIFLLMLGYFLLYVIAKRSEEGKSWRLFGFTALIVIAYVGRIYSANMTLMLHPEDWARLYAANPHGVQLPSVDPTTLPRWLYMMAGSLSVGGVFALIVGLQSSLGDDAKSLLRRAGGLFAAGFGLIQLLLGWRVFALQPDAVRAGLSANPTFLAGEWIWVAAAAALPLIALGAAFTKSGRTLPALAAVAAVAGTTAAVVVRDGIRDLTLLSKGYDVWAQPVASNWQVVAIFLGLFVAGLAVIGWMIRLMKTAKGVQPKHV
jgi:hypothetical protein